MNLKYFWTTLILSAFVLLTNGQDVKRLCDSYEINRRALLENQDAPAAKNKLDEFTRNYIKSAQETKQVYIIPVVFHVVHNYGPENISKDQILDAIKVLNEDFRKLNDDTSQIVQEFKSIAADCEIEFRLAKIDPDGNCTDGIERVQSMFTYNANEDTKMEVPAWPRDKYLNVWTVASLESGAAGYSYYPYSVDGNWGESVDGVILLSTYVGSIGTSSYTKKRTLTHEIGHYLNLMHPWGNTNDPGLQENCNEDDEVSDTPNTIGNTTCNLSAISCGSLDNVQNYMDYSYCGRMYTEGQKLRMHAALNSSTASRNNLWTATNLIATGTSDNYTAAPCIPVADFIAQPLKGCTGSNISFYDNSYNSDTISSWNWSFPGGNPSSSNQANPIVSYSTEGSHTVSLTVGNNSGTNSATKTDYIKTANSSTGLIAPISEGFESTAFPSTGNISTSWEIETNATTGWQRTTSVSASGSACLYVRNPSNNDGEETILYTPNILTDSLSTDTYLKFKVAYAEKTTSSDDRLSVYVSTDCGSNWHIRYTRSGNALSTNGGVEVSSFVPNSSQWRQENVSLGTYLSYPNIIIKFVCTSGEGNNLYLDDINLGSTTNTEDIDFQSRYLVSLFPNPIESTATLEYFINQPSDITVSLFDITGKKVASYTQNSSSGLNQKTINMELLPAGVYTLQLKINDDTGYIKLLRQ